MSPMMSEEARRALHCIVRECVRNQFNEPIGALVGLDEDAAVAAAVELVQLGLARIEASGDPERDRKIGYRLVVSER